MEKELLLATTNTYSTQTTQFFDFYICLKFNNFDDFAGYILKSGKISFSSLLFTGATKLTTFPKFQNFINNRDCELPKTNHLLSPKSPLLPLARPLQVLSKSSFWDNLLKVYFTEVHPLNPVISIKSFNQTTTSKFLLSAIYYAGYNYQPNKSSELTAYMDNYAIKNVKSMIKICSLENVQASVIYATLYHMNGNISLARTCQSNATRMSYSLGLHIDNKKLTPIDRYNRQILFSRVRAINAGFSLFHQFPPSYLTEYGEFNPDAFQLKYQLPDKNCIIYHSDPLESYIYSECSTALTKFNEACNFIIWEFRVNKEIESVFHAEWDKSIQKIMCSFLEYCKVFTNLKKSYNQFKQKIEAYEFQTNIIYYHLTLEMYGILKSKKGTLTESEISNMIDLCDAFLEVIKKLPCYNPLCQFFRFFIGFNLITLYQSSNLTHKQLINIKLKPIVSYLTNTLTSFNYLNYLILKTGIKFLN